MMMDQIQDEQKYRHQHQHVFFIHVGKISKDSVIHLSEYLQSQHFDLYFLFKTIKYNHCFHNILIISYLSSFKK
ncbi:hypothetical protein pb186bvf_011716 [Paramecium bursaria]